MILGLPISPYLKNSQIIYVADQIKNFFMKIKIKKSKQLDLIINQFI